jgi:ABC-type antimicrobial peptide transport system permease subunit
MKYILTELWRRPGRSLTAIISVALGVALFISLQAYANGYRQAARAPLVEIGADLAAQRQGAVPEKFEGLVFPHSVAPIHREAIDRIRRLAGVQAIAELVFFWVFENKSFIAGLGIDANDTFGPGRLQASITSGRFLDVGESGVALADSTYARQAMLALGGVISISGQSFTIIGLANTTRAGQLANANIYIPLADARRLANAAPQVRSVHQIQPDDANMLFIKADQTHSEEIAAEVKKVLGDKGSVSSGRSFAEELGLLFTMVDRFGFLVGAAAFLFAAGILVRLVAGGVWERRREIGLMRAVGWRRRDVTFQFLTETTLLALIGGIIGLGLSGLMVWLMGQTRVVVPVPWELNPSPHFLPGGAKMYSVLVAFPARLTPELVVWVLGLVVVSVTLSGVWLIKGITKIKPAEVLRE